MSEYEDGLPIEEFIQALSSQLDRAQTALAVKARFGMPLTFAVKDISIDLRAHISMRQSRILVTPAGPNDAGGSIIHLALTSITKPMIQENTLELDPDEPNLQEVLGEDISDEERRRLEWAGIRTVSQLRELEREGGENVVEQVAQIPAMRLRAALRHASRPRINDIQQDEASLRIKGTNLKRRAAPQVRIGNRPVNILQANEKEIIVERPQVMSGILAVETEPGLLAEADLSTAVAKAETIDLQATEPE